MQFETEETLPFIRDLLRGHEGDCPHCGRYAKVYKRRLHYSMGWALIQMWKIGGAGLVHLPTTYVHRTGKLPGDLTKGKHWGLIENIPDSEEKTKRTSGNWRLTEKGVDFVHDKLRVPEKIRLYDDKAFAIIDEKLVSISDVLKSGGFNYPELMAA